MTTLSKKDRRCCSGFITPGDGSEDVFNHREQFKNTEELQQGDTVSHDTAKSQRGTSRGQRQLHRHRGQPHLHRNYGCDSEQHCGACSRKCHQIQEYIASVGDKHHAMMIYARKI